MWHDLCQLCRIQWNIWLISWKAIEIILVKIDKQPLTFLCEYDNIYSLKNIENSLILEKDGKVGLASGTGDVIINADYSEIRALRKRLLRWVYSKKWRK